MSINLKNPTLLLSFLVLIGLSSCEKDISVDLPTPESKVVVEGSIKAGQPPLVLLSRNAPFFGEVDLSSIDQYFVQGAIVQLSDGFSQIDLAEICLSDLDPEFAELASAEFGIPLNEEGGFDVDFCFYTLDTSGTDLMIGIPGRNYELTVFFEEDTLTALTSIPEPVGIDSLWWEPHPDVEADSLVRLNVRFTDPDTLGNFYRYFTKQNSEPFYPGINSVFDDLFVNGEQFDFSLDRGQSRSASFDLDTYGFFWRGDTIILEWASIDQEHYSFWQTLEYDAGNVGPFASATTISTNVQGGLGIFGGYGSAYDTLIVGE
jgi:hypothetical protein